MNKDALRIKHFNEMNKIKNHDALTDCEVERYFETVLSFLPNDGMLYKYRPLDSFDYILDSLKNDYIYMPTVTKLNDRIDTTFLYKKDVSDDEIKDYYRRNKYKIFHYYLARDKEMAKEIDGPYLEILDALSKDLPHLSIVSLLTKKHRITLMQANEMISKVKRDADKCIVRSMEKENISLFHNLGHNFQKDYRVFSMSEVYDQDSMWAYYCGNNAGFCIEYDFKKAKSAATSIKRKLLNICKVRYSNKKELVNIFDIYDVVYLINKDEELFFKTNKTINESLLRKKKSWSQEKEWRIVTNDNQDKIKIDLVSKIIVDESILNDERTGQIIELAREKHWEIVVRRLDMSICDYVYEPLKDNS